MTPTTYHHWKLNQIGGAVAAMGIFLIYGSVLEHGAAQSMPSMFPSGLFAVLAGMGMFAMGVSIYLKHWNEHHA